MGSINNLKGEEVIFIIVHNILILSACYLRSDDWESDPKVMKWTYASVTEVKQFTPQLISLTAADKTLP